MTQEEARTYQIKACWRVADDCCTDEGTREEEKYSGVCWDKEGENKKKQEARHKSKKIVLKASIVTKFPVSL